MVAKTRVSDERVIMHVPAMGDDAQLLGDRLAEEASDPDSDDAWIGWIDSLRESQAKGTIKAYKLAMDQDGNLQTNIRESKQILLGSWAHDLYNMEELALKIQREFLKPGELAGIRFAGTSPGQRGIKFNKIVMLQRPDIQGGENSSQLGEIMSAMQMMTTQQQQFMERVISGNKSEPAPPAAAFDWKGTLQVAGPLLAPFIAALAQRMLTPAAPASAGPDLGAMVDVLVKLKDLTGDGGGGSGESNDLTGIIKAVAPGGLQLLAQLAANQRGTTPATVARRLPPPKTDIYGTPTAAQPTATQIPSAEKPNISATAPVSTPTSVPQPAAIPSQGDDAMIQQMKMQLEQLAQAADENQDPVELARLVLSMLPHDDNLLDQLFNAVSEPKTIDRLALISPIIRERKAWYERLRAALEIEMAEPEALPAATSEETPGRIG